MNYNHILIAIFIFISLTIKKSFQENDILPAVPLVVKNPYLSTWMSSKSLVGSWPNFWTGAIRGFAGLVRVDGKAYEFLGNPAQDAIGTKLLATQTGLKVTPTQSIFTLTAGPIELTLNFFTPIDPTDLKRLSIPASYFVFNAKSLDKNSHKTEVYFDISGEWSSGNAAEVDIWDLHTINGTLVNFDVKLKTQKELQEANDAAEWGTVKFFTDSAVTYEAASAVSVRSHFVTNGKLPNTIDKDFRPIDKDWPVFAFARELNVGPEKTADHYYGIAHVRRPAIGLTDGKLNQLWESYFNGDDNQLVRFVFDERTDALKRANELDVRVENDANKVGGSSYVKVVSAALRQAYGGIELVGTPEKPWMMLKEISSDGNCQTVDVVYPHFPVQYYLNPKIIKYLLEPLLDNQEKGFFPHKYSMHDLGSSYPRCIGHRDGKEEAMEVEESANMIIMMAAYVKATNDKEFAVKHYQISKQWTQFLVDHGLFTGNALTTDDFLGPIKNSTNLSAKAIVGIAGMAQLSTAAGNHEDSTHYRQIAEDYIKTWQKYSEDSSGKHLKLSYNSDNTWFLLYNLYADKLLGTNLVPQKVYTQQDEWYLQVANKYGVPLESGKPTTKVDWEMFTAASSDNPKLRQMLFDRTALWLRETNSRAPFSDWIDTVNGNSPGFINRPVIGGVFAPLTIKH